METKVIAVRHWDDLVFENRNKAYGAYSLRRTYPKRVILGWGVSVAMFIILLWTSKLCVPKGLTDTAGIPIPDKVVEFVHPPSLKDKPKQQRAQPVKSFKKDLPPLVVSERVEEIPIEEPVVASLVGEENGESGVEGVIDGISLAPVEPPVPIEETPTLVIAEHMPEFEGGNEGMIKYIIKTTRFPASCRRIGMEGTVYVQFIVMADGSVDKVEVLRGFHPDCDKEAIRVIKKMPKWLAGSQNGKAVNVRMVVPIRFKIS